MSNQCKFTAYRVTHNMPSTHPYVTRQTYTHACGCGSCMVPHTAVRDKTYVHTCLRVRELYNTPHSRTRQDVRTHAYKCGSFYGTRHQHGSCILNNVGIRFSTACVVLSFSFHAQCVNKKCPPQPWVQYTTYEKKLHVLISASATLGTQAHAFHAASQPWVQCTTTKGKAARTDICICNARHTSTCISCQHLSRGYSAPRPKEKLHILISASATPGTQAQAFHASTC